ERAKRGGHRRHKPRTRLDVVFGEFAAELLTLARDAEARVRAPPCPEPGRRTRVVERGRMRFADVMAERFELRRGLAHRDETVVVSARSEETDAQPSWI